MAKKPTKEELQLATKIPDVLERRFKGKERNDLIRLVYNEAIDDAANFLKDLAPHNSAQSSTLLGAEQEVRAWLVIPEKDGKQPVKRTNMLTLCVKCGKEMMCTKNEVLVVEMAWIPPRPANIFMGDEWGCMGCGVRVVPRDSYGANAIHVHIEDFFMSNLKRYLADERDAVRICWEHVDDHDKYGEGLEYLDMIVEEWVKNGEGVVHES